MQVSVILPTHQPDPQHLRRTLAALRAQTLPPTAWETLVVDNASPVPLTPTAFSSAETPSNIRWVREEALGLSAARRRGVRETSAPLIVLVDDDNLLAADYLETSVALFQRHPDLGAAGGKSLPQFAARPAAWTQEFFSLLALRDLGTEPQLSIPRPGPLRSDQDYPAFAPIGAGLVVRRASAAAWLSATESALPDRRGRQLSSGGDCDLVMSVLEQGASVGYFPELGLRHLIPLSRLSANYLGRLNRGIQRSWVQVLAHHGLHPWKPIDRWTLPLRALRAYLRTAAWRSPAHYVRWQGLLGRFEGQADLTAGVPPAAS